MISIIKIIKDRRTLLFWRWTQVLINSLLMILKIVQFLKFTALGDSVYFSVDGPGISGLFWIVVGFTYLIIGYLLIQFNNRWKTGPFKDEIFLDMFLVFFWIINSLLNSILFFDDSIGYCNEDFLRHTFSKPHCAIIKAQIFFSWLISLTYLITIFTSIMRWRNRTRLKAMRPVSMNLQPLTITPTTITFDSERSSPSTPRFMLPTEGASIEPISQLSRQSSSYIIQDGVLQNGEHVLFFRNNNNLNVSHYSNQTAGRLSADQFRRQTSHQTRNQLSSLQNYSSQKQRSRSLPKIGITPTIDIIDGNSRKENILHLSYGNNEGGSDSKNVENREAHTNGTIGSMVTNVIV